MQEKETVGFPQVLSIALHAMSVAVTVCSGWAHPAAMQAAFCGTLLELCLALPLVRTLG